jgi:hypothetical protein
MSNFKVGDWVRTKNGVFQIEDIDDHDFIEGVVEDVQLYFTDKNERWEWRNNVKLWQPQVGEWCWFWNTNEMPTLEQFSKYYDLDDDLGNYEVNTYKLYQYCEPFIGELPTFLKRS